MIFVKFRIFGFENLSRHFKFDYSLDKNNGYFTSRPVHISDSIFEFFLEQEIF